MGGIFYDVLRFRKCSRSLGNVNHGFTARKKKYSSTLGKRKRSAFGGGGLYVRVAWALHVATIAEIPLPKCKNFHHNCSTYAFFPTGCSSMREWLVRSLQASYEWKTSQNNVLHLSRFISKVEVQTKAVYLLACGGIHPGRVEPASPIELTSMASISLMMLHEQLAHRPA